MDLFLRIIKHLLPTGRAWRLTPDKPLRSFFEGLTGLGEDSREFIDRAYFDLYPATTRDLDAWDVQFALPDVGLDEQGRRDRLDGAWKAFGGQDPRYIQDTLQAAGFDVYVHEWWDPNSPPTSRDPRAYLTQTTGSPRYVVECGEALAECGEALAEAGESNEPQGYPLVNKVVGAERNLTALCGEVAMGCGEALAECGQYDEFTLAQKIYTVPDDPATWPFFLYLGGANFPDLATIDNNRREEFEDLALKICPLHQWLGILVRYQ